MPRSDLRVVTDDDPGSKIARLQEELGVEIDALIWSLVASVDVLQARLKEAQKYPVPAGVKEEFRSLAEAMAASANRLEALRGRS